MRVPRRRRAARRGPPPSPAQPHACPWWSSSWTWRDVVDLDRPGHVHGQPCGASMPGFDVLAVVELISVYDAVQQSELTRPFMTARNTAQAAQGMARLLATGLMWPNPWAADARSGSGIHGCTTRHPSPPCPSLSASSPRPPKAPPRTEPASRRSALPPLPPRPGHHRRHRRRPSQGRMRRRRRP